MNKNIRQDFFLQVKKTLDKADKAADLGNHFRAIVLMGDVNRPEAYSWLHAPQEDKLLLQAMRNSDLFAYSAAKALEIHYEELKKQKSNDNESDNEETN